jgi:hypothetical protein
MSWGSLPIDQVERSDSGVLVLDGVSFSPIRSTRLLLLLLFNRMDSVDSLDARVEAALPGLSLA